MNAIFYPILMKFIVKKIKFYVPSKRFNQKIKFLKFINMHENLFSEAVKPLFARFFPEGISIENDSKMETTKISVIRWTDCKFFLEHHKIRFKYCWPKTLLRADNNYKIILICFRHFYWDFWLIIFCNHPKCVESNNEYFPKRHMESSLTYFPIINSINRNIKTIES